MKVFCLSGCLSKQLSPAMGQLRTDYFLVAFRGFCSTTFMPPLSELKSKLLLKCFLMKKNILCVSPLHSTSGSVHSSFIAALRRCHSAPCLDVLPWDSVYCAARLCCDQPSPCTQTS